MDALPRVKAVAPARAPLTLNVEWADGAKSRVDLTGLVYSSRHFKVFAADAGAFRQVKPDEFGTGIEWANGLDYSARTLKILADEQKPLTGRYLHTFERKFRLNTHETAWLLKVTPRTIKNWREAEQLPVAVCIALRRFEHDPTAFAAHYRPIDVKPRGRPKTAH
jgi:Protein of unknown function (DUF2442)